MSHFRKLISLLTALALCFSLAGVVPTAKATDEYLTGYFINPLYADVIEDVPVCIPGPAPLLADGDTEYLSSTEAVAAAVRDGMKARSEEIVINFQSTQLINTNEKLKEYVEQLLPLAYAHTGNPLEGDYLRWQFGSVGFGSQGYQSGSTYYYTLTLKFSFYTTKSQEDALTKQINTLLNQLNVKNASDYEKLKAIYDYICANITYDHANLNNDSYTLKYTAYAALMDGTAVCQGYALLFYRLALQLGVDARLIAGDGGGPHGWNIAELNNLYYNLDSTWDAGVTDYRYFLVCPDNFTDHLRYNEYNTSDFHRQYPMDDEDYKPQTQSCAHSYTGTVTKEAGCTSTGTKTFTCSKCGNSYTEEIKALGHNSVTDPAVNATCTAAGKTQGSHCSRCNEVLTKQETVPAQGHKEVIDSAVPATCTTSGKTQGSHCSRCNEVLTKQETVPAQGHKWNDATCTNPKTCTTCNATEGNALGHSWDNGTVTTNPTETQSGIRTYSCTRCYTTKTETIPPIDHTHRYTAVVTDPTCTSGGYTTYTCTCGESYRDNETDPLNHNWGEGKVTKEPTETETGIRTYTCSRCSETKTESIPVISHTHRYTSVVTDPTCTNGGYTTYTCSCGESYRDNETDPLNHNWGEGKVTKEPTETETGIRTYTCSRCSETKTESIPVISHTHRYTSVVTEPTCTSGGYTTYTCSCGASYTDNAVSALGHNWDEGKVTREPTETETGVRTYTCSRCSETKTESIPCILPASKPERLSGSDRIETATKVADALKEQLGVSKFDTIIIANGDNFADALAGSYLAAVKGAPILLRRNSGAGDAANETYISQNLAKGGTVYILGGQTVVPASVENALTTSGYKVTRLAGSTRIDTNLAILNEAGVDADDEILIVTGWNYADCLSASATGKPIFIVNENTGELSATQIEFLQKHANNSYTIIGGTAAISEALENAIDAIVNSKISRVYGATREDTSVKVAQRYCSNPSQVLIAFSRNFPDGLCGGPLAYAYGAPLLLTNSNQESYAADYVESMGISTGIILGGPSAVSDKSIALIFGEN